MKPIKSKLAIIIAGTLSISILFTSCNKAKIPSVNETLLSETETSSIPSPSVSPEVFTNNLESGKYLDAIEYYNKNLVGNINFETEVAQILSEYCNNINNKILVDEYTAEQAQTGLELVKKVNTGTNILSDSELTDYIDNVKRSLASKVAYTAAEEFAELSNWKDAIISYSEVIEQDSNYSFAQQAIIECSESYKTEVFTKADEYIERDDYLSAIALLKELREFLSDDSEVSAKLTVYEKSYISNALSKAESAFVAPATDYIEAMEIINAALQNYPENAELNEKKEYYLEYAPVNLYGWNPYNGGLNEIQNLTDNMGNTYNMCFGGKHRDQEATYDIGTKYNLLSFSLFSVTTTRNNEFFVEIRGDGIQLLKHTYFLSQKPIDLTVDITGVTDLTIKLGGCGGSLNDTNYGISDVLLQKTVK